MQYEEYPLLQDWILNPDQQDIVDSFKIKTTYVRAKWKPPEKEKIYAFDIETWPKSACYVTEDLKVIKVSAVADSRYAYETPEYKEFLKGKKVTFLGEVKEFVGNDINFETMYYTRELRK